MLQHLKADKTFDPDGARLRIIKSKESGNGKSLVARRLSEDASHFGLRRRIFQQCDSSVENERIITDWLNTVKDHSFFHLDVTPSVKEGRTGMIKKNVFCRE